MPLPGGFSCPGIICFSQKGRVQSLSSENHIGKTIDIFGYRGILKQIRYVYASGQSTNNSYTITLDRVRKRDTKESHIADRSGVDLAADDTGLKDLFVFLEDRLRGRFFDLPGLFDDPEETGAYDPDHGT